jgi:hypothetical protein
MRGYRIYNVVYQQLNNHRLNKATLQVKYTDEFLMQFYEITLMRVKTKIRILEKT